MLCVSKRLSRLFFLCILVLNTCYNEHALTDQIIKLDIPNNSFQIIFVLIYNNHAS